MDHKPFSVVRIRRPGKSLAGPDRPDDLFCVRAAGNRELVRTDESYEYALINGALGPQSRKCVQALCDALNAAWAAYLAGPERSPGAGTPPDPDKPPVAAGVVCKCEDPDAKFCPAHGRLQPRRS